MLLRQIHKLLSRLIRKICASVYFFGKSPVVLNGYVFTDFTGVKIKKHNLGDDINIPLLKHLSGRNVRTYNTLFKRNINILAIGSIIEICTNSRSIIWGSGSISGKTILKQKPLKVLAVRGPLTREYLLNQGIECPVVYGDPALLCPLVYSPRSTKKYKLGLIPHYKDEDSPVLISFLKNNPDVLLIRMRNYKTWKDVIDKICSCECIASSSLHGLIISDAYRIPNTRIVLSNNIVGGDFKYKDYYGGVNKEYIPPLNCSDCIDRNEIEKRIRDYSTIDYDPNQLLNTFPVMNR